MIGRYNIRNKKAQIQAQIDAQSEAAKREARRRTATRVESVPQPEFRGAALDLQDVPGRFFEVIISGPAETGKTFACCWLLDTLLRRYPGSQGVLARKIRDTIVPTVLQTYLRVAAMRGGTVPYGGQQPLWYDYDNGSRLWLAGLDKPGNALSSERDFIYVNQAEDLAVGDWETLTTRATGRAGNAPISLMLGDCNPQGKTHWIVNRSAVHLLRSYHRDNPSLFNERGEITDQGKKSLGVLANLSEPRRSRLFLGLWASAEGQVYPKFNKEIHCVPRFAIPSDWLCFRVIDFGFNNPFVCLWFAYDRHNDCLYCYRELYMTGRTVEEHARQIGSCEGWTYDVDHKRYTWLRPIKEREPIIATICDHDAEDRATLQRHGIPNEPAFKAIKLGIEAVDARLANNPRTGAPSLYYFEDALVEVDTTLRDLHLPTCTVDEYEAYVWQAQKDGKPAKDQPVDRDNHGLDATRYAVAFVDDIGAELDTTGQIVTYDEEYTISPV